MAEDRYVGVPAICGTESKPLQCFLRPFRFGLGRGTSVRATFSQEKAAGHKPGAHGESLSFTQSYGKQALVLREALEKL